MPSGSSEVLLVEMILQAELFDKLADARRRFSGGKMKKPRMKHEVLPDRQLGIERERLRHVADAAARIDVAGVERLAEQQRLAFARRQQPGEHFHRRGLAAAVRADEAENLAAFDREAHSIDGGEIAKTAGKVARRDHRLAVNDVPRRHFELERARRGCSSGSNSPTNASSTVLACSLRLERGGRAGGENFPVVHREQPIEPLGLFHVGGGDDHAHAGPARPDAIDQFPELTPRQRIDAGRRLVEDQTDRDRGSASSTARVSAACRRTISSPGGRRTAPGRCCAAARQSAIAVRIATARTAGRKTRYSRERSGRDKDSCRDPAA